MSEEQPVFKVRDRRLFNPDGTPRDVEPREDEAQPATSAATAPDESATAASSETIKPASAAPASSSPELGAAAATASGEPHDAASATGARQPQNFEAERAPGEDEEVPGVDDPASFVNFLMSIASNAAAALGMMEHPATGQRGVDLPLGKHWIDVLGMLHQKTLSNLVPQERQILEGLLADLRMQYVSLTSSAQQRPSGPRGFTGRDIIGGK